MTIYCVETWDCDKQAFTPQVGVPSGPYTKWGLRTAIRALRSMGYPCDYSSKWWPDFGDPSVSIYSVEVDPQPLAEGK